MTSTKLPDNWQELTQQAFQNGWSRNKTAAFHFGVQPRVFQEYWSSLCRGTPDKMARTAPAIQEIVPEQQVKVIDDNNVQISFPKSVWKAPQPKIEELVERAGFSLEEWEFADTPKIAAWTNAMRPAAVTTPEGWSREDNEPIMAENWSITIRLRRRFDVIDMKARMQMVLETIKATPKPVQKVRPRTGASGLIGLLGISDLHIGKFTDPEETGEEWNTELALEYFQNAVQRSLELIAPFNPEVLILPIGNDLLHTDNNHNQTTKGTPLESDKRHNRLFRLAWQACKLAVDQCLDLAPVWLPIVPGNHARDSEWKIGEVLSAVYSSNGEVYIDNSLAPRKYVPWEKTALMFTHGDQEKPAGLRALMEAEAPETYRESTYRECVRGHFHVAGVKQHKTTLRDGIRDEMLEVEGMRFRTLPSMCGADGWHNLRGYKGGFRSSEAHLYSSEGYHFAGFTLPVAKLSNPML